MKFFLTISAGHRSLKSQKFLSKASHYFPSGMVSYNTKQFSVNFEKKDWVMQMQRSLEGRGKSNNNFCTIFSSKLQNSQGVKRTTLLNSFRSFQMC